MSLQNIEQILQQSKTLFDKYQAAKNEIEKVIIEFSKVLGIKTGEWKLTNKELPKDGDFIVTISGVDFSIFYYSNNPEKLLTQWFLLPRPQVI